jgi:hypothetical protein
LKVLGVEKAAGTKLDITKAELVIADRRGIKGLRISRLSKSWQMYSMPPWGQPGPLWMRGGER